MLRRYLQTQLRFLAFKDAPIQDGERDAFSAIALSAIWLVGVGRYWDDPNAFVGHCAGLSVATGS